MPEPTLAVAYAALKQDVGFFLGYGRTEADWDATQTQNVERSVQGGLRKFYYCDHDWSFLRPVTTLTLAQGAGDVALPDDCGGVEGKVVINSPQNTAWWPLDFCPVGTVYQRRAELPNATGRPTLCAIEVKKGTGQQRSSRYRLLFDRPADQEYTLKFQYYVNPDYLSGSFPYAYGGPQHAETLLESCLAVAEKILDGDATLHAAEFEKCLANSKGMDRRNKPQDFGYNGDSSDLRHRAGDWRHQTGQSTVTFNGVAY